MKKNAVFILLLLFNGIATANILTPWLGNITNTDNDDSLKTVTFLGISTKPVSTALKEQFEFPEGHYLLVDHVKPDSPAEKAGIKQFHILLQLEDQILINEAQLKALIRSKQPTDTINLSFMAKGKVKTVPIVLESRQIKDWNHWQGQISKSLNNSLEDLDNLKSKMQSQSSELKDRWNRLIEENKWSPENFSFFNELGTKPQTYGQEKWIVKKQTDLENYSLEIIENLKTYMVTDSKGNILFKETFIDRPKEILESHWEKVLKELTQEVSSLIENEVAETTL